MLRLARAWHDKVMSDEVVSHAFSHGFHPDHTARLAAYPDICLDVVAEDGFVDVLAAGRRPTRPPWWRPLPVHHYLATMTPTTLL